VAHAATEILICGRRRRLEHPFTLARRVRRATGLAVRELAIGAKTIEREPRGWSIVRDGGHCIPDATPVA
jgi:hypothetical protein